MADFTQVATGNHNDPATWDIGGGRWPGDGVDPFDTATLTNGLTCTVAAGFTWELGDPAAAVLGFCLRTAGTAGTGVLILNGTLVIHEKVLQGNANWQANPGAVIRYDGVTHGLSGTWQITDANSQHKRLLLTGTSVSNLVLVESVAGGGTFSFTNGTFLGGGCVDADYTLFRRIGASGTNALTPWVAATGSSSCTFDRCHFDICGRIQSATAIGNNGTFRYADCTRTGSVGTEALNVTTSGSYTGGTRQITDAFFDKPLSITGPAWSVARVAGQVTGLAPYLSFSTTAFDLWEDCLFDGVSFSGSSTLGGGGGSMGRGYWISTGNTNPRWANYSQSGGLITIDWVLQRYGGDLVGDAFVLAANPSSVKTYRQVGTIALFEGNSQVGHTAKIVSPLGNLGNARMEVLHCAYSTTTGGETGIQCGESQTVDVGTILTALSNIAKGLPGSQGLKVSRIGSGNVQDIGTGGATGTLDYNSGDQVQAGSDGKGYNGNNGVNLCTSAPGVHDVDVPHELLNHLRDITGHWRKVVGAGAGASRLADKDAWFAEFQKRNRLDGVTPNAYFANTANPIGELITWVRDGWRPQNDRLFNAGHDGATIGAMPYQPRLLPQRARRRPVHARR
ncbi:MAG TPA: hypothetical protein VFN76_10080 [Candidatus Limnocylindria bacterium]|nr:hypothetical protein [Candidatus Limnocylindria bacterium]